MDYTEKKLRGINRYEGVIIDVHLDQVELPDGKKALREVVEHPGGVAVLPIDGDGYAYCVEQYRYAFSKSMLEVPAGKKESYETPLECAVRELSEETGISAGRLVDLGEFYASPGFCHEILHIYLALDLTFGKAHLDEGEFLKVVKMHIDDLVELVTENRIADAKTVVAVLKSANYLKRAQVEDGGEE